MDLHLPLSGSVTQTINPWTWFVRTTGVEIGAVNVYLGESSNPDLERRILGEVGTYGRQIGQIGDALAVLVRGLDAAGLSREEQDAIDAFSEQIAKIDRLKRKCGVVPALEAS